jgi:cholinesterase
MAGETCNGGFRCERSDLPTATTIENLEGEIRDLYAAGGRYFLVALLPTKIPGDLRTKLPGVHVVLSHWGESLDHVIENPSQYGISNVSDKCAGRAVFGEDPTPCKTPDTYFYFHDGHPSIAVQKIVAIGLKRELEAIN